MGLRLICTCQDAVPTFLNIPTPVPSWKDTWTLDGAELDGWKFPSAQ
jgi:hypothetical protein